MAENEVISTSLAASGWRRANACFYAMRVGSADAKVFDILLALVEQGGHVVQKDDLMKRVWPGTFVEDGNLTQSVSILRKALGEARRYPIY